MRFALRTRWADRGAILYLVLGTLVGVIACESTVRALPLEDRPGPGWPTSEHARKARDLGRLPDGGVIFVGSSVVDVGIDPVRFDSAAGSAVPSYNAALLGASPTVVEAWTRHVVLPSVRPAAVVVGVSSRDLNNSLDELRGSEDLFFAAPEIRHRLGSQSLADRVERELSARIELVKYRHLLRRPIRLLRGEETGIFGFSEPGPRGFETHFVDKQFTFSRERRDELRGVLARFDPSGRQRDALLRLIRALRGAGAQVLVVDMPVTAEYLDAHPGGPEEYRAYEQTVERWARAAGASFLDAGTWERQHFAEPLHLNGSGAQRLTEVVADTVRQNCPACRWIAG